MRYFEWQNNFRPTFSNRLLCVFISLFHKLKVFQQVSENWFLHYFWKNLDSKTTYESSLLSPCPGLAGLFTLWFFIRVSKVSMRLENFQGKIKLFVHLHASYGYWHHKVTYMSKISVILFALQIKYETSLRRLLILLTHMFFDAHSRLHQESYLYCIRIWKSIKCQKTNKNRLR